MARLLVAGRRVVILSAKSRQELEGKGIDIVADLQRAVEQVLLARHEPEVQHTATKILERFLEAYLDNAATRYRVRGGRWVVHRRFSRGLSAREVEQVRDIVERLVTDPRRRLDAYEDTIDGHHRTTKLHLQPFGTDPTPQAKRQELAEGLNLTFEVMGIPARAALGGQTSIDIGPQRHTRTGIAPVHKVRAIDDLITRGFRQLTFLGDDRNGGDRLVFEMPVPEGVALRKISVDPHIERGTPDDHDVTHRSGGVNGTREFLLEELGGEDGVGPRPNVLAEVSGALREAPVEPPTSLTQHAGQLAQLGSQSPEAISALLVDSLDHVLLLTDLKEAAVPSLRSTLEQRLSVLGEQDLDAWVRAVAALTQAPEARVRWIVVNAIRPEELVSRLEALTNRSEADLVSEMARRGVLPSVVSRYLIGRIRGHQPDPSRQIEIRIEKLISPEALRYAEDVLHISGSFPDGRFMVDADEWAALQYHFRVIRAETAGRNFNYRGEVKRYYEDTFVPDVVPGLDAFIAQHFTSQGRAVKYVVSSGMGANEQYTRQLAVLHNAANPPIRWLVINNPAEWVQVKPADASGDNTVFVDISRSGNTEETLKTFEFTFREFPYRIVMANGGTPLRRLGERRNRTATRQKRAPTVQFQSMPSDIGGRLMRRKPPMVYVPMYLAEGRQALDAYVQAIDAFDHALSFEHPEHNLAVELAEFLMASFLLGRRSQLAVFGMAATGESPLVRSAEEIQQLWMEGAQKQGAPLAPMQVLALPHHSHRTLEGVLGQRDEYVAMFLLDHGLLGEAGNQRLRKSDVINPDHAGLSINDTLYALADGNARRAGELMPTVRIEMDRTTPTTAAALATLYEDLDVYYTALTGQDPNSNPEVAAVRALGSERLREAALRPGNQTAAAGESPTGAIASRLGAHIRPAGTPTLTRPIPMALLEQITQRYAELDPETFATAPPMRFAGTYFAEGQAPSAAWIEQDTEGGWRFHLESIFDPDSPAYEARFGRAPPSEGLLTLLGLLLRHEADELALRHTETLSAHLSTELAAFIRDGLAYHRLTATEKAALRTTAAILDAHEPDEDDRFTPNLDLWDRFADAPSRLLEPATWPEMAEFLRRDPALADQPYDEVAISGHLQELMPTPNKPTRRVTTRTRTPAPAPADLMAEAIEFLQERTWHGRWTPGGRTWLELKVEVEVGSKAEFDRYGFTNATQKSGVAAMPIFEADQKLPVYTHRDLADPTRLLTDPFENQLKSEVNPRTRKPTVKTFRLAAEDQQILEEKIAEFRQRLAAVPPPAGQAGLAAAQQRAVSTARVTRLRDLSEQRRSKLLREMSELGKSGADYVYDPQLKAHVSASVSEPGPDEYYWFVGPNATREGLIQALVDRSYDWKKDRGTAEWSRDSERRGRARQLATTLIDKYFLPSSRSARKAKPKKLGDLPAKLRKELLNAMDTLGIRAGSIIGDHYVYEPTLKKAMSLTADAPGPDEYHWYVGPTATRQDLVERLTERWSSYGDISEAQARRRAEALVSKYLSKPKPQPQRTARRSHRFPKIIKGQESAPVFERHLKEVGITSARDIQQVLEGGVYWTQKSTGKLGQRSPEIRQAMADALAELLGRSVTLNQLATVIGAHEAIHAQLTEQDVVRIRDDLLKALGQPEYAALLEAFQRQYGSYPDESEAIEELIASAHLERLLGNPLRLLDADNHIITLDPKAAAIIRRAGIESVIERVNPYYQAKQQLADAAKANDAEAYRTAFAEMEARAKAVAQTAPQPILLELTAVALKEEQPESGDLYAEGTEVLRAAGQPLTDDHRRILREVASEAAWALTRGIAAEELEQDLMSRTGAFVLGDYLPADIKEEPTDSPEGLRAFEQRLAMMGHAEAMSFLGATHITWWRPNKILVRPVEDLVQFHAGDLHELIHDLSDQGYLPISHEHELITHAATALVLAREEGLPAIHRFGGEMFVKLFEHGEQLFRENRSVDDFPWLFSETQRLMRQLQRTTPEPDEQAAAEDQEQADKKWEELTPLERRQIYLDFERLIGTVLGGYAWAWEQQHQRSGLKFVFDYAVNVVSRMETTQFLSAKRWEHAQRLRRIVPDVVRRLTRNPTLEIVDWEFAAAKGETPEIRYEPENNRLLVPMAAWLLDEKVLQGLLAQVIFRVRFGTPDVIEPALKEDPLFRRIWDTMELFGTFNAARGSYLGAVEWVQRLYEYRHTIPNLTIAQQQMADAPLHLQYLAGVHWLWDQVTFRGADDQTDTLDPRIVRPEVREALSATRPILQEAFQASPERLYALTRNTLYPIMQRLYEQSVEEGMQDALLQQMAEQGQLTLSKAQQQALAQQDLKVSQAMKQQAIEQAMRQQLMEQMAKDGKLSLSETQQQALKDGNLRFSDLSQEQQQQVNEALEQLSPKERQKIQQAAQQQAAQSLPELTDAQRQQLQQQMSQMSQAQRDALRQQAQETVEQAGQQFSTQMGDQALPQLVVIVIRDDNQQPSEPGSGAAADHRLFQQPSDGQAQPFDPNQLPPQLQPLGRALQRLVQDADQLEQLAAQADGTAQHLRDTTGQLKEEEHAGDLARRLDELAQALREQAKNLRAASETFDDQAGQAQHELPEGGRSQSLGQQMAQQSGQLTKEAQALEQSSGNFADQTPTVRNRVAQERGQMPAELAEALHQQTGQLSQQARQARNDVDRLQQLTMDVAHALEQDAKQGQGQTAAAAGQPASATAEAQGAQTQAQGAADAQQQASASTTPPQGGLKPLDFSPVTGPPQIRGEESQPGTPGYGPGLRESDTELVEGQTRAPQEPIAGPPTGRPALEQGRAASPEEMAAAGRLLAQMPDQKERERRAKAAQPAETPVMQTYRKVLRKLGAQIARLAQELKSGLQLTESAATLGRLPEGDRLDPESLAMAKVPPHHIFEKELTPGEFNFRVSFLVDVSGSMGQGEGSLLHYAAEGMAMFLEATKELRGVDTEIYAFADKVKQKIKDFGEHAHAPMSLELRAALYNKIFEAESGGTADVAAIKAAIKRISKDRGHYPGLVIIGIGIGPGTEEVKDAYFPYGYQIDDAKQLPALMQRILQKQLRGRTDFHNLLIVLTDGNPNADNAAAIQKIAKDHRHRWPPMGKISAAGTALASLGLLPLVLGGALMVLSLLTGHAEGVILAPFLMMGSVTNHVEDTGLPIRTETRMVQRTDNGQPKQVGQEFLIINDQAFAKGRGGPGTPSVEIVPFEELGIPLLPGETLDSLPARYIARVGFEENGQAKQALVPLSPSNLKQMADMIAVFNTPQRSNLYERGPASTGKNTLLYTLVGLANRPVYLMSLNYNTSEQSLIALPTFSEDGTEQTGYRPSAFVEAAREGAIGVLDETNKPADTGVLAATYPLLDQGRFVTMPDGEMIIARPDFLAVAMGNPNQPPYVVSQTPSDFDRRYQFVEFDYFHAPQRKDETNEQYGQRKKEAVFLLRLQAPNLYVQNPHFFEALVELGGDIVESFEQGELPAPMTVRGLIRIVRHLEMFPQDVSDFMSVFGRAYNLGRLDAHLRSVLDGLVGHRMPGEILTAPADRPVLSAQTVTKGTGSRARELYQIVDAQGHVLAERQIAAEKSKISTKRLKDTQTTLRHKLDLMKAELLGEHVLIEGHTGTGKTATVFDYFLNDTGRAIHHMQLNAKTTVAELWGRQAMKGGRTVWEKSPLLLAMEEGRPILIDDIGKPIHQAVVSAINNVLQSGWIRTPYGVVYAKPGFQVVATTNPEESRYLVTRLSGEVEDRFMLLHFDYMSPEEEEAVLREEHPAVDPGLIRRLIEAARQLREKEIEGHLARVISVEDLEVALQRFQEQSKETLLDLFLSSYGVEERSDYVDVVKQVFAAANLQLSQERFVDYAPAPTPADILGAATDHEQRALLFRLLESFRGDSGLNRFRVVPDTGVASVEVTRQGRSGPYSINLPSGIGPVKVVDALKEQAEFTEQERAVLQQLLTAYQTPPAQPKTGDTELDTTLQYTLNFAAERDDYPIVQNLDALSEVLARRGLPKAAGQRNLEAILGWLAAYELLAQDTRARPRRVLEQMEELASGRAAPAGQADHPATSLLGLRHNGGAEARPLLRNRVPLKLVDQLQAWLRDFDAQMGSAVPAIHKAYYASGMSSYASIDVDGHEPVLWLDEQLAQRPDGVDENSWTLLQTLLLGHEGIQYHLRRGAQTDTADLTEELALFAEVDMRLWFDRIPEKAWEGLEALGEQLDATAGEANPARFLPYLQLLVRAGTLPDEEATWRELAGEFAQLGGPRLATQPFDLDRFQKLRNQLHTLLETQPEPVTEPTAPSLPAPTGRMSPQELSAFLEHLQVKQDGVTHQLAAAALGSFEGFITTHVDRPAIWFGPDQSSVDVLTRAAEAFHLTSESQAWLDEAVRVLSSQGVAPQASQPSNLSDHDRVIRLRQDLFELVNSGRSQEARWLMEPFLMRTGWSAQYLRNLLATAGVDQQAIAPGDLVLLEPDGTGVSFWPGRVAGIKKNEVAVLVSEEQPDSWHVLTRRPRARQAGDSTLRWIQPESLAFHVFLTAFVSTWFAIFGLIGVLPLAAVPSSITGTAIANTFVYLARTGNLKRLLPIARWLAGPTLLGLGTTSLLVVVYALAGILTNWWATLGGLGLGFSLAFGIVAIPKWLSQRAKAAPTPQDLGLIRVASAKELHQAILDAGPFSRLPEEVLGRIKMLEEAWVNLTMPPAQIKQLTIGKHTLRVSASPSMLSHTSPSAEASTRRTRRRETPSTPKCVPR